MEVKHWSEGDPYIKFYVGSKTQYNRYYRKSQKLPLTDQEYQYIKEYFDPYTDRNIFTRAKYERDAQIVIDYYFIGITMLNIAERYGITKGRVQQILGQYNRDLRKYIRMRRLEDMCKENGDDIIGYPIEHLEFDTRIYNTLKHAGIRTIGEILILSYDELLNIHNMGVNTLDRLVKILEDNNLHLYERTKGDFI